jgi:AbiU2
MPTQIERVQAHASHLLDAFIQLRERYAMLEPMLFVEEVPKSRGAGKQWRGFVTLRNSLFLSCAQDIAKLSLDDDKRTPSLKNLIQALEDDVLRKALREVYASWHTPLAEEETDPQILQALAQMDLQEEAERRLEFDEKWEETRGLWSELSASAEMRAFLTIRDKVTAHIEVQFVGDKYQLVDISTLNLKWSGLRQTLLAMQKLIENLSAIIRNSCFAWNALDDQLSRASRDFWLPTQQT